MPSKIFNRVPALFALFSALGLTSLAHADEHAAQGIALLPKYQKECAACHIAYPPGLLPAASWQRLMSRLPQHFGTDASLDAATTKELSDWLKAHAGTSRRVRRDPSSLPEDRISRAGWFTRQHGEIAAKTWRLAAVKSASNCAACHTQAEQGDFSEHNVRIPR